MERIPYQIYRKARVYKSSNCSNCSLTQKCLYPGSARRTLKVSNLVPLVDGMREKMKTVEAERLRHVRSTTIEPFFGCIKANKKLRRFIFRGMNMVSSMWKLELVAHNVERLAKAMMARELRTVPVT